MIPIFDSLCHPTLTGNWFDNNSVSKFNELEKDLNDFSFIGAAAVGIHGVEDYNHEDFMEKCKSSKLLYPVAGFNLNANEMKKEMNQIINLGYKAIKIHPRFNNFNFNIKTMKNLFSLASDNNIIIFYCTYQHSFIQQYPAIDPFYFLVNSLKDISNLKVILLHGGDVDILKYAELVRFNYNLLLDLSMTLFKYKGSSIDLDIDFLFNNFDQRICVGTDYPEHSHRKLRQFFEKKSNTIEKSKLENIAYKNIKSFLGID